MENKKLWIKKRIPFIIEIVLSMAYFISCFYLYFMQSDHTEGQYFESDLPYHISMALDGWGYSLTAIIYKLLSFTSDYRIGIALFLAICTIAAIWAIRYAITPYVENGWVKLTIAWCSGLVMPFFIKTIQNTRYIGYQSPSIWHNSTYIVMKILAISCLIVYFRMCSTYRDKINWKEWVGLALLLLLTTATKTSFVAVFAPAAFLFLIIDLFFKVSWKKAMIVAATLLPTIGIILLQEAILFGEDTGNGITIDFGYTVYLRAEYPQLTMILSALFPVLIFLFNIYPVCKDTIADWKSRKQKEKPVLRHRIFLTTWTMWFFGAVELLFLKETGERVKDANFSWGYDFALFALFIVSMVYFVRNLQEKSFLGEKKVLKVIYGVIMGGVLAYHTYCGIVFFIKLLQGVTYFM